MFELTKSASKPKFVGGGAAATDLKFDDVFRDSHKYRDALNSSVTSLKRGEVVDTIGSSFVQTQISEISDTLENDFLSHVQSIPRVRDFKSARVKVAPEADVNASPLQIWEGRVLNVSPEKNSMDVLLSAQMSSMPDHTGEIDLQWVSEQDIDLVKPGAVFYLTLFKRTKRGTVENSQELRFRRVPNWTRRQLQQVQKEADKLLSNVKRGVSLHDRLWKRSKCRPSGSDCIWPRVW